MMKKNENRGKVEKIELNVTTKKRKRKERQESTLSHMECLFGFCAEPRGT